jgi:hypothetical protein
MTKKEFTYWKENPDKFLNADLIYIHFNKNVGINHARILRGKNYNTPNPDIRYGNSNSDLYVGDKVVDIEFDENMITLKTKLKHAYADWEDKKIKECLVGEVVTNTFSRKDIKSIDIRIYN